MSNEIEANKEVLKLKHQLSTVRESIATLKSTVKRRDRSEELLRKENWILNTMASEHSLATEMIEEKQDLSMGFGHGRISTDVHTGKVTIHFHTWDHQFVAFTADRKSVPDAIEEWREISGLRIVNEKELLENARVKGGAPVDAHVGARELYKTALAQKRRVEKKLKTDLKIANAHIQRVERLCSAVQIEHDRLQRQLSNRDGQITKLRNQIEKMKEGES